MGDRRAVVFDANFLLLLLDPNALPPRDPATNTPIDKSRERIELLLATLDAEKTRIIIPTPALSEVLIGAGEAASCYLEILNGHARFRIAAFDQRAAVEAAAAHRDARQRGDKREGTGATWAKVKFDRQIVAIAKVEGAATIYSDDTDIRKLGESSDLTVIGLAELPLPPVDPQQPLGLDDPEDSAE